MPKKSLSYDRTNKIKNIGRNKLWHQEIVQLADFISRMETVKVTVLCKIRK
jgi:hypothetical protein